jgi:hypothetical protein
LDQRASEEIRVLGRRWAREVASPHELDTALRLADGGREPMPPSAHAFLAAYATALEPGSSYSPEVVALFLDGIATSEGEE